MQRKVQEAGGKLGPDFFADLAPRLLPELGALMQGDDATEARQHPREHPGLGRRRQTGLQVGVGNGDLRHPVVGPLREPGRL